MPRKIVDFPNPRGIIIHKFSPESPTNPRQIQNLHYNICYRNLIFGCLGFAGHRWNWSVKLYLGTKKIDLFSANLLTSKFPPVQSLNTTQHNTTQHNTTQHIEETLSTTINLSGTRPVRNFSYEKFPAGLFCLNHFRLAISQLVQ